MKTGRGKRVRHWGHIGLAKDAFNAACRNRPKGELLCLFTRYYYVAQSPR